MQIQYPSGTPVIALLNTVTPYVIPIGARGYSLSVLTGTASIQFTGGNLVAGLPAGFSDSDPSTLLKPLTITCAAASSAYVRYLPKG